MAEDTVSDRKRKPWYARWRPQFTIRTALILTAIVALTLGLVQLDKNVYTAGWIPIWEDDHSRSEAFYETARRDFETWLNSKGYYRTDRHPRSYSSPRSAKWYVSDDRDVPDLYIGMRTDHDDELRVVVRVHVWASSLDRGRTEKREGRLLTQEIRNWWKQYKQTHRREPGEKGS